MNDRWVIGLLALDAVYVGWFFIRRKKMTKTQEAREAVVCLLLIAVGIFILAQSS